MLAQGVLTHIVLTTYLQIGVIVQLAFTGAYTFILSDTDEYRTRGFFKSFFVVTHVFLQGTDLQSPEDDDAQELWIHIL